MKGESRMIYLVRHGQTEWNALHKVQGSTDNVLNEEGIKQARQVAEKMKNITIDLIISSPMKRAIQTAEIIRRNRDIPIQIDNRLREREFGTFEGKDVRKFDFTHAFDWDKDLSFGGSETTKQFYKRVYEALENIKEKAKDKNILISGHSGISIVASCYFNGIPVDGDYFKLRLGNCEIAKFQVKG